eukprot:791427-Prymnesium_polylepis.2
MIPPSCARTRSSTCAQKPACRRQSAESRRWRAAAGRTASASAAVRSNLRSRRARGDAAARVTGLRAHEARDEKRPGEVIGHVAVERGELDVEEEPEKRPHLARVVRQNLLDGRPLMVVVSRRAGRIEAVRVPLGVAGCLRQLRRVRVAPHATRRAPATQVGRTHVSSWPQHLVKHDGERSQRRRLVYTITGARA